MMSTISSSLGGDQLHGAAAPSSSSGNAAGKSASLQASTPAALPSSSPSTLSSPSPSSSSSSSSKLIAQLIDELMESPLVQLAPKHPSKCPIFCCFYAEFDIKRGPVVRYQSPEHFMDQNIDITTPEIHELLAKTFDNLEERERTVLQHEQNEQPPEKGDNDNTPPPAAAAAPITHAVVADKQGGEDAAPSKRFEGMMMNRTTSWSRDADGPNSKNRDRKNDEEEHNQDDDESVILHRRSSPIEPVVAVAGESIFDATSEYIITGSELTGKIITLSTHSMHVMTRPTQITHERYERNALLFSVGVVLRRAADPRPFRPLISKLALTLRSMEIEGGALSDPQKVPRIQPLLERLLVSMNSSRWECNLLLDQSTVLNLKLFHPPKPQAAPVFDYQVPVMLIRDVQMQMHEWDLAINWVVLHIDGITNARQISIRAQVDLEMVLACLRVLKHHGVIAVVDMFLYSNRYEFTDRAASSLLARGDDQLLQEMAEFVLKQRRPPPPVPVHPQHPHPNPQTLLRAGSSSGGLSGAGSAGDSGDESVAGDGIAAGGGGTTGSSVESGCPGVVAGGNYNGNGSPRPPSPLFADTTTPSFSYPPSSRSWNPLGGAAGASQRISSNYRSSVMMVSGGHSLDKEASPFGLGRPSDASAFRQKQDRQHLLGALAELYCACNRNLSFGDLWLSLTSDSPNEGSTSSTSSSSRIRPTLSPNNNNNNNNWNWNEIFGEFDHRRFFTFGVIQGLLVRVHSYPYYTGPPFPQKNGAAGAAGPTMQQQQQGGRQQQHQQLINPGGTPMMSVHQHLKHQVNEERRFQQARRVAALMDGTHCDDRLVSMFEMPFNQLVDLVERYSGTKVLHIYSTGGAVTDGSGV